ncbi:adenylate cyclase type 10-like isoform X2 [Paroedura picta]|uniref:adenylate cyclase type 10-like isoform X2 n=1 Tax=Paroedura picta TaxID=143630 RepID=UPI004056481F
MSPPDAQNTKNEISTLGKVAAHVPDLIVYGDFSQEVPFIETFDGVLLFIDISGFTALTEKYGTSTNLESGADQVTQTLNRYVGDIVEEVLVFGGDILNFAGDALLALWRVNRRYINDIITLALKCSLKIQQDYGVRDTEVGLELRVKIGVSAGHISKVVVGDHRHQYFLVIGRAVDEVRLAQNLAKAGEIILSPNGWELCQRKIIEIRRIPNERAVKVKYLKSDLQEFDEELLYSRCTLYLADNHISENEAILRKASVLPPNAELERRLRKFVMRNVLKKIDDDQPLEYLSELRPVTIVFVNLQFDESANTLHLSKAVQDASIYITEMLHPLRGKINKIFMFDKGCTFLCVFGLPGDKQADESAHALDCAHKIYNFCSSSLMKVRVVSIGVTSGSVFCGVVGHRVRHEYTVIGRKVNLAARIMVYYPGMVTCDAVTYAESKLPPYFFQEVPLAQMKGILNPGTIYKFLGVTEKTMMFKAYLTKERSDIYPLLGRKREIEIFEDLVEKFKASPQSHILMYEGHLGSGKSQLLSEIAYLGQAANQKVVAMELTKINLAQNFFTIRTLMAMFLGIDTCKSFDARQHILLTKVRGTVAETHYCLLNNLFYVKFLASEIVSNMDVQKRNAELETVLVQILRKSAEKEIIIFVIDDAQFIDSTSWDFLDKLMVHVPILLVLSLSPFDQIKHPLCSTASRILGTMASTYVRLKVLTPAVIVQKACQDLGVVTIARELETFLIQRSHGNPFFCEELLHNLHINNALQYHIVEQDAESEDEWDSLFTTALLKTQNSKSFENKESEEYICTVKQNVKLYNVMLPPMLKDLGQIIATRIKHEEAVMQCKVMGFCTPLLKETAYELWLKSQKKALHLRCASYLECDAHQCKYCGEGDFIAFHRYAVEGMLWKIDSEELRNEPVKDNVSEAASEIVSTTLRAVGSEVFNDMKNTDELLNPRVPEAFTRSIKGMESFVSIGNKRSSWMRASTVSTVTAILKKIETSKVRQGTADHDRPSINVTDIFRTEYTEKAFLTRLDEIIEILESDKNNFNNIGSCYCEEIVEFVIVPLSHHCMAVENYVRAFYYLLECAAAYLHLSNNYMAFTYLNTAECLLKSLEPTQKIISQFEMSVLYCLKGEVSYNMGQIHLAKRMEKKALDLLKKSFPLTIIGAFFMSMVEFSKHITHQKKQNSLQMANGKEKRLALLYQQGRCLSVLWQAFSLDPATKSKKFCHLAALMTVNCAEESQDEAQIISSYMEFSLCCQLIGCQQEWMKYEEMAIQRSSHLGIVGGELFIIAKVVASLAYMKLCLGSLLLASKLGFRAHEICEQIRKSKLNCSVLFDLFNSFFLRSSLSESAQVLNWLEKLLFRDDNIIGKACFVSGCLDLMLYAGFQFKPIAYCLDFVTTNAANCVLMSQNGIMLNLYSSLAIWFARLNLWNDFKEPFEQARRLVRRTSTSLTANYGFCKLLECEALWLQKCIEDRPEKVRELRYRMTKNLEQAMVQCSTSPVYYPRVYHLKAYVQLMLGNDEESQIFLATAIQNCFENYLEKNWLTISQEWWFTGKIAMEDEWLKMAPDFPVWEVGMTNDNLKICEKYRYLLKMPELDINQSFPIDKSEDQM